MKKKIIILLFLVIIGISYAQNSLRADKETIKIVKTGNAKSKEFTPYIDIAREELSKRFIVNSSGYTDKILTINLSRKNKKSSADLICYIKDNESGIEKMLTVGSFQSASTEKFRKQLLSRINKAFPISTRITEIENENIVFDIGYDFGVKKGDEFDIVTSGNKKIGLAIVTNVDNDESTAKIIRGKSNIEEGNFLKYRMKLVNNISLIRKSFPIDIKVNPLYEEITGKISDIPSEVGSSTILCFGHNEDNISGYLGTGLVSLSGLGGWNIIDLAGGYNQTILKDYINLEFMVGGGINWLNRIKWARDPNVQYDDGLDEDSGETNYSFFTFYFDTFATIHLFPVRSFSLSFSYGYYGLAVPSYDKWTDYGEDDTDDSVDYKIKKEWLQYHPKSFGGLMFGLGINFWFD